MTEMAGRASVELKSAELGFDLSENASAVTRIVDRVKELEAGGWSFEAADASFELMLRDETGDHPSEPYRLESWRAQVERRSDGGVVGEATVKIMIDGERVISSAEGNGPVNALDNALRNALLPKHPDLADMKLVDYKVRILDGVEGTDAVTRVLISSTDGVDEWQTVGVHENVIEASWLALDDALKYWFTRQASI